MPAGRPPIYNRESQEDIDLVDELVNGYFKSIYDDENNKYLEPPTVTGLALYLNFCDKSTLYDYKEIDQFSHSIKKGLSKIEQYHEISVAYGDKCTGNIFALKNMGWKDRVEVDNKLSGEVNVLKSVTIPDNKR